MLDYVCVPLNSVILVLLHILFVLNVGVTCNDFPLVHFACLSTPLGDLLPLIGLLSNNPGFVCPDPEGNWGAELDPQNMEYFQDLAEMQ